MQKINSTSNLQLSTGLRIVAVRSDWVGVEDRKLTIGDTFVINDLDKYGNAVLVNIDTKDSSTGCRITGNTTKFSRFRVAYKNEYKKES